MKKILFFMTTLLMVVLISCGGGGDDIPNPVPPSTPSPTPQETPTINVSSSITSNGVSLTSQAGETSVSFTTNSDWTLSIVESRNSISWCTPSATSGSKGNITIKFTVTENPTYEDRSASVTIKAGTASSSFKITQKAGSINNTIEDFNEENQEW